MKHRLTSQAAIRAEFWRENPHLPRRKIRDYSGKGKMHSTDTRCAFVDFVDYLERNSDISSDMANKVTL